jgi:hypothetical protein
VTALYTTHEKSWHFGLHLDSSSPSSMVILRVANSH